MNEEYALPEDFKDSSASSERVKNKFIEFLDSPWWTLVIVVLVAVIAFSLGRISVLQESREPVKVINEGGAVLLNANDTNTVNTASVVSATAEAGPSNPSGRVVGSKNGTKYHYPWCGGAKQISPKNLITFNSIEEAKAKGYTPARNCKGLK